MTHMFVTHMFVTYVVATHVVVVGRHLLARSGGCHCPKRDHEARMAADPSQSALRHAILKASPQGEGVGDSVRCPTMARTP
ncbi:hypothetical protein [Nitrobacter sp.]|uniref:hypothetical protein n=1 Tax=Nitrobacter sp. TaxID=29420 RepID=UPI003F6533B6